MFLCTQGLSTYINRYKSLNFLAISQPVSYEMQSCIVFYEVIFPLKYTVTDLQLENQ